MLRRWFTLLALVLPLWPLGLATAQTVPATVGLTLIELPSPEGFVDGLRDLPAVRQMGERMPPPTNRLLALFMSAEDRQRLEQGQPPQMQRYFMAQTLRQTEASNIPVDEFAQVRTLLRDQYKSLLTSLAPDIQNQFNRVAGEVGRDAGIDTLQLKIGALQGLEIFDDRAAAISLLAITKYAVQVGETTEEIPMAMAMRNVTRAWLPRAAGSN